MNGYGVPFAMGREFARGESDTFLDWLQEYRPELFDEGGVDGSAYDRIRVGSRVTVRLYAGQNRDGSRDTVERTGRAVILGPGGWVLCLNERGTAALATPGNVVRVGR